jgi:hypothetical protein
VTVDQRLTAAREYLACARGQRISRLPRPVLQRVATELRRQLGQVLDVIGGLGEASPTALDEGQREVLGRALGDAIWWRTDTSRCEACIQSPSGVCEQHAPDLNLRDAYIRLSHELGIEVTP